MVEMKRASFNASSIKLRPQAHSTPVEHLPFTLLSNSSFNYLSMYPPKIPARSSSNSRRLSPQPPRSRTTTEGSTGSDLTAFEILEAKRGDPNVYRLRPENLEVASEQDGYAGSDKSRRVPAPQCPRVAERREGASLPRSPGMQDLDILANSEEMSQVIAAGEPLFGASNQRSRRLANREKSAADIAAEKAREDHLAMTMDTLTFSPATVKSDLLPTPPTVPSRTLKQPLFPLRSTNGKTGLGLGFIGTQAIQPPASPVENVYSSPPVSPVPTSPGNWRFTLSTRAPSPTIHSRSASTHLEVNTSTRLDRQLTGSSRAESRLPSSGAQSSMVDSYYYGSQSGRTGASGKESRGPSRLGMNQDPRRMSMDMLNDSHIFAFSPPSVSAASSPIIPIDFTASPSPPIESISRRSSPTSPHKIKRKPVPSVEEWTLAVNESTHVVEEPAFKASECKFDLPVGSHTVPRAQRQPCLYIHGRGAMSTPAFTSSRPPAGCPPPLPISKSANGKSSMIENLKSFATSYRTRSFGKKTEGEFSATSISTGESTQLHTPRESYEDFINVPVRKQDRSMGVAPVQVPVSNHGYTTRAQREAARLAEVEVPGKKKAKGRLAKIFSIL